MNVTDAMDVVRLFVDTDCAYVLAEASEAVQTALGQTTATRRCLIVYVLDVMVQFQTETM